MQMREGEEKERKKERKKEDEEERFYPCLAWKKIQPVFFDASLGFMDLMTCHLVFISYAFFCFCILFALGKQKYLVSGNKRLLYLVLLCIGTKEVIL